MKKPRLTFRTQIFLLMLALVIGAVYFVRSYFIQSLTSYQAQVEVIDLQNRLKSMYHVYVDSLPPEAARTYKAELEALVNDINQLKLSGEFQNRDLALYSLFILIFITLTVGGVFLISMNVITRPLVRLQTAVEALSVGNFNIRVEESPRSPINPLIRTFNTMVSELEENRRKLLQAQKDMVWREMAKIMAHEIKNPLTPIQLATQRIEHNYLNQSPNFQKVLTESTRIIHEEIASLQRLVRAFSAFAQMPALQLEIYDLNEQLTDLRDHFKDESEIELHLAPQPIFIHADRLQLRQVWVNLIQNAILSKKSDTVSQIVIKTESDLGRVLARFSDHGTGITPENLDRVFKPYFTTRERGTGLGLAVVQRIVELHGGEVTVESEFGQGTTFSISLKQKQQQQDQPQPQPQPQGS